MHIVYKHVPGGTFMLGNHIGEITSILFMAVALSMDSFSISLGMGMQQLRLKRIAIIGLVFGIFHIFIPFSGIIVGKMLSSRIGHYTTLAGGLLLVGIGLHMIFSTLAHTVSESEIKRTLQPYGIGLFLLSLSVSIDSFPVGLSLGMSGAKTAIVLSLFGAVCTITTWTGLIIGRKVRGLFGAYSEVLGGSILLAFGFKILFGT